MKVPQNCNQSFNHSGALGDETFLFGTITAHIGLHLIQVDTIVCRSSSATSHWFTSSSFPIFLGGPNWL